MSSLFTRYRFYMNVVGYKEENYRNNNNQDVLFYMNVVGYKDEVLADLLGHKLGFI